MIMQVYHKTLSSALNEVRKKYNLPDDLEIRIDAVNYGETERMTIMRPKKPIHIQIYRMDSGTYELNAYAW